MTSRWTRFIQFGLETTSGDEVNAGTRWRGTGTIVDLGDPQYVEEDIAVVSGSDRTTTPKYGAQLDLDPTPLTFEQFPHLCELAIETDAPAVDGAGTGYLYEYVLPQSAPTCKTYTVEAGDGQQEEQFYFGHCPTFKLSGKEGENWMMQATLRGRKVVKGTMTAGVALPSVYEANWGLTRWYISALGGAYNATEVTNTILQAELTYTSGRDERWSDAGDRFFSHLGFGKPSLAGSLVMEHNASAVSAKDDRVAETGRKIRIDIIGPALGTPGSYTTKLIRLDFCAKFLKAEKLGELRDNDIVKLHFESRFNATANDWGTFLVVNELSALPR